MHRTRILLSLLLSAAIAACGGGSTTDSIQPTGRPVAQAGENLTVTAGRTATLAGSGSLPCSCRPLAYAWTLASVPVGSQAVLDGASTPAPRLRTDLPGVYVLSLTVRDGQTDSLPATVQVQAVPLQMAPPGAAAAAFTPLALDLTDATATDLGNGTTRFGVRLRETNPTGRPLNGSYLMLWFSQGLSDTSWKIGPAFFIIEPVPGGGQSLARTYEYDVPSGWIPLLWEYGTPLDATAPNPALPQWRFRPPES